MTDIKPITNEPERKAAVDRLTQLFHTPDRDAAQLQETRDLAQSIQDYEMTYCAMWNTPTDGVDEIEFMLDQGNADLPGLLEIFGGRQPFLEFMLREQPLDDATIDAILARYNTKRKWLDKPFCQPPGWSSLLDGEWLRAGLDAVAPEGEAGDAHEPVVEMESWSGLESEKEPELVAAAGG